MTLNERVLQRGVSQRTVTRGRKAAPDLQSTATGSALAVVAHNGLGEPLLNRGAMWIARRGREENEPPLRQRIALRSLYTLVRVCRAGHPAPDWARAPAGRGTGTSIAVLVGFILSTQQDDPDATCWQLQSQGFTVPKLWADLRTRIFLKPCKVFKTCPRHAKHGHPVLHITAFALNFSCPSRQR